MIFSTAARRGSALVCLLSCSLLGCRFDNRLEGGADIVCGPAGECPEGWECNTENNQCRQIGSDAPGLESADITPTIGNKGTTFVVTLKVSKPLAKPPTVTPLNFVFNAEASSPDERTWVFHYTPTGLEKETVYRVAAELKDTAGNTAAVPVGTVTLDFKPPLPIPGSMKVVPGVARPGQTVLVQIDFDEVLRDTATLVQPSLAIAGLPSTVKNTNTLAFRFTVPPATASGSYAFSITNIEDLAGNAAEDITPTNSLSIEAKLMVDSQAPTLRDVLVNRDNFSRNPGFDEVVLTFKAGNDAETVGAVLGDVALDCARTGMSASEDVWRCSHLIDANDAEGGKPIKATAIDVAGNAATEARSVVLDFTAPTPVVGSMRLTPASARVGQTVVAQLNFSEVLAAGATLQQSALGISNLASAVQNNVALAFTFNVPVGVADGAYAFSLTGVQDLAGNVAAPGALEQELTVDSTAPVISNVQLNSPSGRYSRVTGFNQVVLTFTVSEAAAQVSARIGNELMNCTAPMPTTRSCTLAVGTGSQEGIFSVQVEARDAVGNGSTHNQPVVFDFTAPAIAVGTLQQALIAPPDSLLQQVNALANGARAVVTFSLTEAVSATPAPALTMGTQAFTCQATGLSYSCTYTHDCSAPDAANALSLRATDLVGNAFSGNPQSGFTIATDCTAPGAPLVDESKKVVWHRAPFGSSWSTGRVGSRLELAADALAESVLVRIGSDLGDGSLGAVASARFTVGTALNIDVIDRVDRVAIWAQSVDGAGNTSDVVKVKENITTVSLSGSDATATSPGLFRSDIDTDVLSNRFADRWSAPTQTYVGLRSRVLPEPPIADRLKMAPLDGDRALVLGTTSTHIFNAQKARWELPEGLKPAGRYGASVAQLDSSRALMFGGSGPLVTGPETWLFDGPTQTWSQVLGAQPGPRSDAVLVRLGSTKLLMFGGQNGSQYPEDTWVFDGATLTWHRVDDPMGKPPGRIEHAMVTLANGDALMFGGTGSGSAQRETWRFEATSETWVEEATGPSPRSGAAMALLSDGKVLLFGGRDGTTGFHDTWLYEAGSWSEDTQGGAPGDRARPALLGLADGVALLFGGADVVNDQQFGDAWLYSPNGGWVLQSQLPAAAARYSGGLMRLSNNRVLLVGGLASDKYDTAWVYDIDAQSWQQASSLTPIARAGHQLTRLPNGKALLTGGEVGFPNYPAGSWVFSAATNQWKEVSETVPSIRRQHRAVPLTDGNVVVFGGDYNSVANADTLVFNAQTEQWVTVTGSAPAARSVFGMTSLGNNRALVQGGFPQTDSWVFNGTTRTWQVVTGAQPSQRVYGAMGSAGPATSILFSGAWGQTALQDTWAFNGTTLQWSQLTGTQPPGRLEAQLAELSNGRSLMFGGLFNGVTFDDTWVFSSGSRTWQQKPPGPHPQVAYGHQLATLTGDRVLLIGGASTTGDAPGTWVYRDDDGSWARVENPQPLSRSSHTLTALSDGSAVLFGGSGPGGWATETWVFEPLGGAVTATGFVSLSRLGLQPGQVTGLSARATTGADGYRLNDSGAAAGTALQLYRTTASGPLFTTCGRNAGTATQAAAIECTDVAWAGGSMVALRVLPEAYSNAKQMTVTVERAELDVYTLSEP